MSHFEIKMRPCDVVVVRFSFVSAGLNLQMNRKDFRVSSR